MERRERLSEAYNYLKDKGLVHKQRDVVERMQTTPPNVSKAFKGMDAFLTDKFLRRFNDAYGNVFSNNWLIFGEGDMLATQGEKAQNNQPLIPLINLDSVGGMDSNNAITDTTQYTERLVPFENAQQGDIAIYQSGESMSPTIPAGSILQIRRVPDWEEYIGYGDIYVLELNNGRRLTKEVTRYNDDPGKYVLCVSHNEKYPPEPLPRTMIRSIWKVIRILTELGW